MPARGRSLRERAEHFGRRVPDDLALARGRHRRDLDAADAAFLHDERLVRAGEPGGELAEPGLVTDERDRAAAGVLGEHREPTTDLDRHIVNVVGFVKEAKTWPVFAFVHTYRLHDYFLNIERIAKVELYAKDSRVAILRDGTRLPVSRAGYARLSKLL